MILLSVGIPGRFLNWCNAILVRLAASAGGKALATILPPVGELFGYKGIGRSFDELGRILVGNAPEHLVIGLVQPDRALRDVVVAGSTRFLLAHDDPYESAANLLAETGAELKSVVRAIANSCPMAMQFDGLPGGLAVRADQVRHDPAGAILAIAAHFGIALDHAAAGDILARVATLGIWPAGSFEKLTSDLPPGPGRMMEGALIGYRNRFFGDRLDRLIWTRDLFALGSDPARAPIEPIELTGGNRLLTFGPYIYLPSGLWTARVVLGFSAAAAAASFHVDAYSDGQLASTSFRPERGGIHNTDLTFAVNEPAGKGVEIRVMVTSAEAKGHLAFGHVVLRPQVIEDADGGGETGDFALVLDALGH